MPDPDPDPEPTRHVWLSDEYSVPLASLCWHAAPSPNADHHCIRAAGHAGKHRYSFHAETRDHSHKDPRP